jgi:hypothetical protein
MRSGVFSNFTERWSALIRGWKFFPVAARRPRVTERLVRPSRLSFVRTIFVTAALIAMAGWSWLLFEVAAFGVDLFD